LDVLALGDALEIEIGDYYLIKSIDYGGKGASFDA
jgi:hypothetical protein